MPILWHENKPYLECRKLVSKQLRFVGILHSRHEKEEEEKCFAFEQTQSGRRIESSFISMILCDIESIFSEKKPDGQPPDDYQEEEEEEEVPLSHVRSVLCT